MQACTHEWEMISSEHCKMQMKIYTVICIYIYYIYMCICTLVKCIASYQRDMHGDRIIGVIVTDIFINQGISLRFIFFQQSAVKSCTAVTRVWYLAVFGSENSCFMQKNGARKLFLLCKMCELIF